MSLHVLIAPDKFKGTLTARQAAEAIAAGWRKARPQDRVELLPISDGGDGFGAVMSDLLGAMPRESRTVDAAHRPHRATWWWKANSKTAVVESAGVIGLAMLPPGKFHPFELDTFGLGAVLHAAARRGAREILIGIGGSATNDGGFGLARALGWEFLDAAGNAIERWPNLHQLSEIRRPKRRFTPAPRVAVDVQNPLLGARGATQIYGPQKGIRPADFQPAERCLRRLAKIVSQQTGHDYAHLPGAGAAGGLGFGLRAFANATLLPGFDLFARRAELLHKLSQVNLVITGEGAIDDSSVMGKGVGELATLCRARRIPCLGLAGRATRKPTVLRLLRIVEGLTDFVPLNIATAEPAKHLSRLAERVARNWPES